MEETRATFKYLKNEGIGQNYRYFYSAWASFEEQHNNADKSLDIVRKGRHCDKPSADLSDQEDAFKLFWELESRCIHCSRKRRSDPPGAGSAEGVPLAPVSAADSASSATLSSAFSSSSGPAGSAASSAAQPLPPSGNTATGAIHHRAVLQTATLLPTLTVAAAESTEPDRSGASQDVSLASRSSLSSTSASASDVTAPLAAELSQLGITPAKRLKLDPSRLLSTASKNRHRLHRPVEARFLGESYHGPARCFPLLLCFLHHLLCCVLPINKLPQLPPLLQPSGTQKVACPCPCPTAFALFVLTSLF